MGLKIKWNDDRVRGATTAILLISRDRLSRGEADNLIQASLADYRDDPEGYKANKAKWADVRELGPLTKSRHVEHYKNLILAMDRVIEKMTQAKRQFNSLLELDNALIAYLKDVR
jgi:CRISPR/Cas system CSM-associated protein Csm2 small subunit